VTVAAASSNPAGGGHGPGAPQAGPVGDPHLALPQRMSGGEACPLCGTPLSPEQDWCLRCGAAARTRLAATPNWKAPIATIAVVAALALAILAAALVKLAGGSGSSSAPATTTVTSPATSTPAAPATTAPAGLATTPTATTPGAGTPTTPGGGTPATGTPGAATPATPSTTTTSPSTGLTPAQREALRKFTHPGATK
jgi:hypothetical protein